MDYQDDNIKMNIVIKHRELSSLCFVGWSLMLEFGVSEEAAKKCECFPTFRQTFLLSSSGWSIIEVEFLKFRV